MRFLTAGESHGEGLTAIIEGLPSGVPIDIDIINNELKRRQGGYGRGGRMQIECDKVRIVSGVRFGVTLGSPLTLVITNRDYANWVEEMAVDGEPCGRPVTLPRPGHADLAGVLKYGRRDVRDILERASARETAVRTAVGAVARQVLAAINTSVTSRVVSIGGLDAEDEEAVRSIIDNARATGNTVGGVIEVTASPLIVGLGSHVHWERRLDSCLSAAIMSIPGIKGVELGAGFAYATMQGSAAHDEIAYDKERGYYRLSNNAGGIEGGMSTGEPIIIRAVMKPIPTLMKPLKTVDIDTHEQGLACAERSDVCAVESAAVVAEAVTAIVLAQAFLEKFGGDAWEDVLTAVEHYRRRTNCGE